MIYIKEHAEEFKINRDRVFAVGFSAGGHLCGCLATMFGYPEVKAAFGDKAGMIRPAGVILAYPVTVAKEPTHLGTFNRLLGKPISEWTDDEVKKFSIDTAIASDSSPMFIWHTAEDKTVPINGTFATGLALVNAGVLFKLSVYPYGPHGVALANAVTRCGRADFVQPLAESWCGEADAFFKTL